MRRQVRRARGGIQAFQRRKAGAFPCLAQIRRLPGLHIGPIAAHRQHVDAFARVHLRRFLRALVHPGAQRAVLQQRRPLRNPVGGRIATLAQRADLRLEHVAGHAVQRDAHIVRLREVDDSRLRARNHRAKHRRLRVRLRKDDDGQIAVIRLRDTRAALALGQLQVGKRHIPVIAAVKRARAAVHRAHVHVVVALGEHLHLHVRAQRHVGAALVPLSAVEQRVRPGLHHQRIVGHGAARLPRLQRCEVVRLRVLDPAGHAAHAHLDPVALLAPEERQTGRAVLEGHELLRLRVGRAVKDGAAVRLAGGHDHHPAAQRVNQRLQRRIAEHRLPVRFRGDVGPLLAVNAHEPHRIPVMQRQQQPARPVRLLHQIGFVFPQAAKINLRRATVAKAAALAVAGDGLLRSDQIFAGHVAVHAADGDLRVVAVRALRVHLCARVVKPQYRAVFGRLRAQVEPLRIDLVRLPVIHIQGFAEARTGHRQYERRKRQHRQPLLHSFHSFACHPRRTARGSPPFLLI